MLERTVGEISTSKPRAYECYKHFQDSHDDIEDGKRIGCPNTSTTKNLKIVEDIVLSNRQVTIKKAILNGSCKPDFTKVFGMKQVAAKFI